MSLPESPVRRHKKSLLIPCSVCGKKYHSLIFLGFQNICKKCYKTKNKRKDKRVGSGTHWEATVFLSDYFTKKGFCVKKENSGRGGWGPDLQILDSNNNHYNIEIKVGPYNTNELQRGMGQTLLNLVGDVHTHIKQSFLAIPEVWSTKHPRSTNIKQVIEILNKYPEIGLILIKKDHDIEIFGGYGLSKQHDELLLQEVM